MRNLIGFISVWFLAAACSAGTTQKLPAPITNNAVAYHKPTNSLYSFAGLEAGKSWKDVSAKTYKCDLELDACEKLPPLPDGVGRLASTAQTIDDTVYIFGGYSVAENGDEISMPEVWAFDVKTETYTRKADMPVPVDDSVSMVYQNRYIYLVSGWHKDDNVVNVQMFDSFDNTWHPASDWLGAPVFGHAGALVGDTMIICDGVQIVPPISPQAKRTFETISACWQGAINPERPTQILWGKLPQLPGKGLYRMAAGARPEMHTIVFAGGSDNAYNYNGIGYDKTPSQPSKHVWGYDVKAKSYVLFKDKPRPTMDHRALVHLGNNTFLTLGGMGENQKVLNTINKFQAQRAPD